MALVLNRILFIGLMAWSLSAQAAPSTNASNSPTQKAAVDSAAQKAAAEKKAAEEKVAAAKKAAEEKAATEKKAAEEKWNRMTPFEKAMVEAQAEDRDHASESFDVVLNLGAPDAVLRDDAIHRDKSGAVKVYSQGVDSHSGASDAQYVQVAGEAEVAKKHDVFRLVVRTAMAPAGLEVFKACQDLVENRLAQTSGYRVVAKSVPRHTLFLTEAEMLQAYGYEKYMNRQLKKKDRNKFPNYKKFMESIEDLLVPRRSVLLNSDKISLSCE